MTRSRLDLFSAAERHQLLVAWQGGEGFATGTDWVAERWEALAAQEPGAPIVECEGRVWTRGQLEARANRLARRLRALGAGPERLVGVLVEWCPFFGGFFLYYPSRRQLPAALRAFIDFAKQARA